ncbi:RNA polymerase sigma-70 factor [Pedococcus sp. 5OH_020]|uniref:RNA polymerase sigma-70 factor n=1 Tax=Pedococcus sp. 5OH_020 TaxID=2989814 RepID=UPI0022E9B8A8|nr:RNA polymerase sigma-70 factor [Pedococcus sp. 5OH_020]
MTDADFEQLRPLLFSIAYRILGSVSDAEDAVQETWLRYHASATPPVSPKAFLSAIVTRVSIDVLRSARVRRERYVGHWLPEPLLTDTAAEGTDLACSTRVATDESPERAAELADSLSMAALLLLERLSPVERAVFVLHDVFGYPYAEIAEIVGESEANCRQLASRARRRVSEERPRFDTDRRERETLARRFFDAFTVGDLEGLLDLLAADVQVYGDGGGKAPQWMRVVMGADKVARMFAGLGARVPRAGVSVDRREVNGQPGAILRDREGRTINVISLDILDGRIQVIRSVINPDKLHHLGPVADAWALMRESRPRGSEA